MGINERFRRYESSVAASVQGDSNKCIQMYDNALGVGSFVSETDERFVNNGKVILIVNVNCQAYYHMEIYCFENQKRIILSLKEQHSNFLLRNLPD